MCYDFKLMPVTWVYEELNTCLLSNGSDDNVASSVF